ncbi:hypothetical protein [Knoellia koreensis]|jgi:hypothetical protein|uniref:Carboxypeptidase regulatory-like domain-containing protein n=1 Tax=Knoellia koreensis TaxID=2730921 RepID=A0A849HIQ3_9MICO|nr:hypothetical protein [Knoellia sp. DB2414S]NNM47308.1 hypothetical protein [Knoellia sp. DB2414S]
MNASDIGPLDDLDVELLHELRQAWSVEDPVPTGLAERVKFAITLHGLEAELAELTSASLVLTRSDAEVARPESITFASSRADVLVNVSDETATTVRIDGWVTAPGAVVQLHSASGDARTTADDTGRFTFTAVDRGMIRFMLWPDGDRGERPVVTPTIDV